MAWVASLLLCLVLMMGIVGLIAFRRSLHDDDGPAQELPPDLLIALGRANESALSTRTGADETEDRSVR